MTLPFRGLAGWLGMLRALINAYLKTYVHPFPSIIKIKLSLAYTFWVSGSGEIIYGFEELKKTKRNKIVLYVLFYYSFLLIFSEVLIV
jgi:hypothetical protein